MQANGIHFYYEVHGSGEPLLLIAGFACDHSIWSEVEPSLASKYRVISFDNRGVGQSSASDGPYSIRQMAEDAVSILDEIGVSQAHVAGHSMGGQIAQELALAHPNRVRSLILLSSCAKSDERGKAVIEMFGELPGMVDVRTSARLIMPWLYTNAFYSKPGAVEQLVNWLVESPFPPTAQGMYHQSRAITASDTAARLGAIRCPTLILVGREDVLLPFPFSEQLAKGIPTADILVLEGTGHGLLIETPEAVCKAMLDFLSKRSATS
ncbi:MAG: alpha/beta hydrolase [Proteobacteria bacterium]|nr:MAG: alpha/beta hydrolase [Pseudomonadota bacterium]